MSVSTYDTDALVRTLCEMIAIKALSGEERPMADYVAAFLQRIWLDVERDEDDNVVGILEPREPGDSKANTLHLSGHTDTVVPVEGWARDPFAPLVEGAGAETRVVGLGASDMKGGLTAMLYAARTLAQSAARPKKLRVVCSFTVCEERGAYGKSNGVKKVLARQPGRWALTTEASCDREGLTITLGCQGHALGTVVLRGRSAHSASPERGRNAIYAAGTVAARIAALHERFRPTPVYGEVSARASAAVTMIQGGQVVNIIPERCELKISRRLAPGETLADFERELAAATANLDGIEAACSASCDAPACCVDLQGPFFQAATDASQRLFGAARYSWNRARTDQVLFAQAGMDVLNAGPGSMGQAHVAGECVRAADLPRAAAYLEELCARLDAFLLSEK
ncbi:MAG: M20/M25/M40 family metallo-hydrolase [Planctomycetes bacterium]|nr:M20/M25/M40 family metallo-hydrolase [Planctomycetota bacterium]